ncbi:ABC transporter permease [Methylobacterium sp. ID0610]|uniref:ABC transporter permease n=1 Tax=Methylobacterium carpenticola TaxID=3344827 RepID=UPI0036C4F0C5
MSLFADQTVALRKQSALQVQFQVLHALILRDIRTRFGRTMWGYAIVVLWPCAHLFVLITIFTVRHMPAAIGDSLARFIFTGMMPMLVFIYLARKMMEGVGMNKPLLSFPDVKLLDVCLSRGIIEVLNACMSTVIVMAILLAFGADPFPDDNFAALVAFLTAVVFAFGTGLIACNIVVVFPPFQIGFALFVILFYGLSGVFFLPEGMPAEVYHAMLWNPVSNSIMLFRAAYYPEYATEASALYVFVVGGSMILIGLAWERFITRYL